MEEQKEVREVAFRSQEGFVATANNFLVAKGQEVELPPNYDVNNSVKCLYLQVLDLKDKQGRPALEVCTKQSITMAIQKMVSKGLDPSKNQCYPIVRGNALNLEIGAYGNAKQAKSICRIRINSVVIREGDEIEIEIRPNGTKVIKHKTKWQNQNNKITGAYAVGVNMDTGEVDNSDIMTAEEIKTSQMHSSNYGKVHNEFPHEMARKTVTSRLAKHYINTSDDSYKFQIFGEDGNGITAENNYDYLNNETINAKETFKDDDHTVIEVEDNETKSEEPTLDDLPPVEEKEKFICEQCGSKVTEKVANFSKEKHGKVLCMKCQGVK